MSRVRVLPDETALAGAAAAEVARLASLGVGARGRFAIALSGGSTPRTLFQRLAGPPYLAGLPWSAVHLFWVDERCVEPDDPESNYHLARQTLLERVPIPAGNVYRMEGELAPALAAERYAARLRTFFGTALPRFDLILLGLGQDGHTASLFPDSPALSATDSPVAPATAHYQGRPAHRITLTLPALNAAHQVFFLATGDAKAAIVEAVLGGPAGRYPAQQVQPVDGQVTWWLDSAAASRLRAPDRPLPG